MHIIQEEEHQMATKTHDTHKPKLVSNEKQTSVPYAIVEAYKSLRVHLTSALSKINGKVIAISSPNASEGKSTTSVNIAIMLSQLNKKVLLIDTDSRRATVHQKLKIENNVGCLDVLSVEVKLKFAIQNYSPFLDILTTGKASGSRLRKGREKTGYRNGYLTSQATKAAEAGRYG